MTNYKTFSLADLSQSLRQTPGRLLKRMSLRGVADDEAIFVFL